MIFLHFNLAATTQTIMSFSDLPLEIVLYITHSIDNLSDLNAFSRTCSSIYSEANKILWRCPEQCSLEQNTRETPEKGICRCPQRCYLKEARRRTINGNPCHCSKTCIEPQAKETRCLCPPKCHLGQAIQWAAENNKILCAKSLIENCSGCLYSIKDEKPLLIATENGHLELVELFLEHSFPESSIKVTDTDKANLFRDAVTMAVTFGHEDIVKLLFNFKPDVEFYRHNFYAALPLHKAFYEERPSMVKFLLLGCDVNDTREREPTHNRALQKAAVQLQAIKYQDLEMIQIFIDYGCPSEKPSQEDLLIEFSHTTKVRKPQLGRWLLSWLDVDEVIKPGGIQLWRLLKGAILYQFNGFVTFLIQEKHLLDRRYASERVNIGCCPLKLAICHGHAETVRILLKHGFNPNGEAEDGGPLKQARASGASRIAKLLFDKRANLRLRYNFAST